MLEYCSGKKAHVNISIIKNSDKYFLVERQSYDGQKIRGLVHQTLVSGNRLEVNVLNGVERNGKSKQLSMIHLFGDFKGRQRVMVYTKSLKFD